MGSDHLQILLTIPLSLVFRPNKRPLPSTFRKLAGMTLLFTYDSHCPSAEEYSSLSSAATLFTSLTLNAAKFSIPFGHIKHQRQAWWSTEVEEAVNERHRTFAAAHRSDEDHKAYISAYQHALSVSAKAETWQITCLSLSPQSNPKSMYSLLRSVTGSPSFSPKFPNCSSPRKLASVLADYLRFHFSVSQPKTLCSKARGYFSKLCRATFPEESHSSFCSAFSC